MALTALLVLLTACGGGSTTETTETMTAESTSTSPTATTMPEPATTLPVATTGGGSATTGGPGGGDAFELGRFIWEEYYLDEGCQKCHGLDARGTADGPDIRGASRTKIVDALLDVEEMEWGTELTSGEIDAVHAYLEHLSSLP